MYRKKLDKVESQKWLKEHKRSLEINVSAANRFISQAIPDLTPAQRSQLHKVNPTAIMPYTCAGKMCMIVCALQRRMLMSPVFCFCRLGNHARRRLMCSK